MISYNKVYSFSEYYNYLKTKKSAKMIKMLMRRTNIFAFDNFWKANGNMSYSSACGGIVSLPLLAIIVILLVI